MDSLLVQNARLCAPDGICPRGWLLVQEGLIARMGWAGAGGKPDCVTCPTVDLEGRILTPGLIDLHAHGALGIDTMDADPEGLRKMARFYARHGVTSFFPTTMTAPQADIERSLEAVRGAMASPTGGAQILGAHVEGPYLDLEKRGAQRAEDVRLAERSEYEALFDSGVVRLITVAPEYPENLALIAEARARDIHVAAGHTRASYAQMAQAVAQGLSQVTHLFNGMEPLHHRKPGALGAALTIDALYCQLIADNVHVRPEVLKLAIRAKGIGRIILITDAMRGAGMPDGNYELGGTPVTVEGGIARTPSGALAGSTLTLDRALTNVMAANDFSFREALPMATSVPAQAMGLKRRKGRLAVGLDADLTAFDDAHQVSLTIVGGQIVYDRDGIA